MKKYQISYRTATNIGNIEIEATSKDLAVMIAEFTLRIRQGLNLVNDSLYVKYIY